LARSLYDTMATASPGWPKLTKLTRVRVLLAQLASTPGDPVANAARAKRVLAEHADAELAIFPETFLSGYELPRASELAIRPDTEPLLGELREVAARRRTAMIVGLIERLDDGGLANSAACIDADGSLAAVYRKTNLFGSHEQQTFAAGEELVVTRLCGRLVAPLICFDVEFPEPARTVALAGAELIVTIAANMEPYGPDHELAARARALDNRRPHAYVNQVGRQRSLEFVGGSCAVGPDGQVIARVDAGAQLLEVELPLDSAPASPDVDYLRNLPGALPARVAAGAGADRT
jgi:(R)-amidase